MYYLYNKKDKQQDDQNASTGGRTATTGPMTVRSRSSARRQLHRHPYPIAEEGQGSTSSYDAPETMDITSTSRQSQSQPHQPHRRPAPANEDSESKQESKKNDQVIRRLLRRRGLQEHDYTEEVMQPRRPNRISCQRCHHDIANNDNQHRILCSDRERHVFCKACVGQYIEVWVEGNVHYDLRLGKQGGTARGLYSLPCMSPTCVTGRLQETSMQPLLPQALFMSCRQKLAKVRSELSRSKPRGDGSSPPRRGRQESPPQQESSSRPCQPQRQQPLYEQGPMFHQQQDQYLQQQQWLGQQHNQFMQQHHANQSHGMAHQHQHYQYQEQQQQQQQHMALPLPTALRRTSTASTGGASQSTQKTQKTQKSVRFSLTGDDLVHDDLSSGSSGSSASSLTTRFPVSVDDEGKTEKEESKRYRLSLLQQQQQQQNQDQDAKANENAGQRQQSPSLTTCECCYEEVSTQLTRIVACGQRNPGYGSHRFCSKCVRLYVEEWVFGAATYTLRPGPQDNQGHTSLLLPCLHGDCTEGGFPDDEVGLALSPRSMEQYRAKINPMRIQKQDDEERLVQMAIRLSLEQEEIKRRVAKLHEEQKSVTRGDAIMMPPSVLGPGNRPPAAVNVPQTTLSNTSSLTSFNTTFYGYPRSLPDMPTGTLHMKNLMAPKTIEATKKSPADQYKQDCEKSVHEVEEAMTQAKVRTCPNCRTKFLKDEDFCNKLKCPSCKTAICYICKKVIPTQGYEHFCIHKQGGCAACIGLHCPLWTQVDDDNKRDMVEMRARGLDEANRIWEESLLQQTEIRVDVDSLLQNPSPAADS